MRILQESSRDFIAAFLRAYPWRTGFMVVLLGLAGLLEGVGVASLLPLLNLSLQGLGASDPTALDRGVEVLLSWFGLTPSPGLILSMIVGAIVLKAALLWLAMRQVGFTVAGVTRDLRLELVEALLNVRWGYFSSTPTGHFSNAVTVEADRAARAYRDTCVLFASMIQVVVYLAVALVIAWYVSLAALVLGSAAALGLVRFVSMSRGAGEDRTRLTKALTGRLVDAIKGIKGLKAMSREHLIAPLFRAEVEGLHDAQRRQVIASETLALLFEPIATVVLAAGLYFGLAFTGLSPASILVLAFVFYRILRHINMLQFQYQAVVSGESAYWSLRRMTDRAKAEAESRTGTRECRGLNDSIRLESVTFSYDETEALTDVSMEIPSGTLVTFTGPSGAGKTTLLDLIAGLHRAHGGTVYIDDVPLDDLDISSWRRSIGYVPQETLLLNGSILENVTLGDADLSREDAERALKEAGAWGFVEEREGGLDALVGDSGARFSGGQRQRISLARALVGRPRLLILDEVTASLDPETEAAICETLVALRDRVTILAISHQDALRRASDIVYTVDHGTVRRTGGDRVRTQSTESLGSIR